ncbi:uncharacterized protein At2g02148 [Cryptomeria japonica]|uniref:uncharacterized protein At2g02148 n=1 Tax=Cryptomeria japonica TaxID=3369 RepID=UPI0027DA705A|nr:uncharacterized protein At2g02148 [Cryptomeria japonica]XP_057855434.2 uncharacterized protein At2g02148 [Cryptomeria japonica]XP_057855435.2 uncharacterized protein At2g02148 [Cryptomeria japonica]
MGSRLGPVHSPHPCHYNLNTGAFIQNSSLHDLNTVTVEGGRNTDLDSISDVDRDAVTADSLDNDDDDDNSADCVHQSYGSSLQLQGVGGVEPEHSLSLENEEPPRSPYGVLTINDVIPIESARARFLQLILDYFLRSRVIQVPDSPESAYGSPNGKDKQKKRKSRESQVEGDPRYVLPLAYVANLYETLVSEVNMRLATLDGIREKSMGVALEAAGGLYRRLVKKFPRKGPCTFKRREMASALEARTKFPELVTREEKRVRFVVVHGLELVEQPDMTLEDADWYKRLTGRHEATICERDYKFYSARHKYRRTQNSVSSVSGLTAFPNSENSSTISGPGLRSTYTNDVLNLTSRSPPQPQMQHQPQPLQCIPHQVQHQQLHQSQHQSLHTQQTAHLSHPSHAQHCIHTSHLDDMSHVQHTSLAPQHMSRSMQPSSGLNVGNKILVLPTGPAKYCDQCGSPYLRESSKFCSECGAKRIGI